MFGYVNVLKDDLKVRDYMLFRSYYCGLCKALGKQCSHSSRLGLSYDMTFLAVLLSSLSAEPVKTRTAPCVMHPLSKRTYVIDDQAVNYAAHASALLYYSKMKDDWKDDKSIKALAGLMIYHKSYKKASKQYPELAKSIKEHLKELSALESEKVTDIDLTADCFAKITQELFAPEFIGENQRPAAWLGYNIGRWIYVADAFSDLDKDIKKKNYNPFYPGENIKDYSKYKSDMAERLSVSMTFTLENAVSGFNLLKIYKNEDILKNILFLSLKSKQDKILNYKDVE